MKVLLVFCLVLFQTSLSSKENSSNVDLSSIMQGKNDDFLENRVSCLDKSIRYRKRPFSTTKLNTKVSILGVHAMSATNLELIADIYLFHDWIDTRCRFRALPGQGTKLTLHSKGNSMSHPGLANLWQPDTHVLNGKKVDILGSTTHITSMGQVQKMTRLSLTSSCPMDLRLFPLDRQMCSIVFQSAAHPKSEVSYQWTDKEKLTFIQGLDYQDRMTPDIRLLGYRFRKVEDLDSDFFLGPRDQLILDLFLERPLGYFVWEVYMPATFIVAMSFSSFWLDRAATPARVSLGVTTVLTITTLMSSTNNRLPATAYPKSIGIFLAGCFLFTFFALLEYSVASFLERRRAIRKGLARMKTEERQERTQDDNRGGRRFTLAVPITDPLGLRPAAVDRYSRIIFPICFLLFQLGYWTICLSQTPLLPNDAVPLMRQEEN